MGKRIRAQRKGRSDIYKAPSHRYKYKAKYPKTEGVLKGEVVDILFDPARSAPLAKVLFENGEGRFILAPESIKTGQEIYIGEDVPLKIGNRLPLKNIPEGTYIHNLETVPGDGGKLIRSSGAFAVLLSKEEDKCVIQMPSGIIRPFKSNCKATIGIVAGGGRKEKPIIKSGKKYYMYKSKAGKHLRVSGVAMNAVDHPFGGGGHQHIGRPATVSRNTPPGRKVGLIAARRTGRRK